MPTTPNFKAYLGDGVYAEFDSFGVILTSEETVGSANAIIDKIILSPSVMNELTQWVLKLHKGATP